MTQFKKSLFKRSLMTLGVVVLTATAMPAEARPPQGGPWMGMFKDISPEGRKIVRDAMDSDKPDHEQKRQERDARERQIADVIGAESFDGAKLEKLFNEQQAEMQQGMEKTHARMVSTLGKLSTADRKIVAQAVRDHITKREERKAKLQEKRRKEGEEKKAPASVDVPKAE